MKVAIIGSRNQLEPLEIIYFPKTDTDGLLSAQEKCKKAIDEADEVWFYIKGSGKHTSQDYDYAIEKKKRIKRVF